MTVRRRLTELVEDQSQFGGPELLPVRLAQACATVLPVAGAGLSLYSSRGFRVPIGASDDTAAAAERLQFTLGEGPCLAAHAAGHVVKATEGDIRRQWPRYYEDLVTGTHYRSIVSVPLPEALNGFAALDLYLSGPAAEMGVDWDDVSAVAETMTSLLLDQPHQSDDARGGGPAWLDSPAALRRSTVWGAIGMINVTLHLCTVDALAVLRGYSYSHHTSLDQIAAELTARRLPVDALFQDS